MEQSFARVGLIEPAELRRLSARSDLMGWRQIGCHAALIGATGTGLWSSWGTEWSVAFFIAHGVAINFLYAGQHELSHSTVFRTRWLNEWLGRLTGFILLTPRDADQIQHFAHHRHTQLWREDGELFRNPFTLGSYLLRLSGIEYWYSTIRAMLHYGSGKVDEPYVRGSNRALVIREARWHLAGYGLIVALSVLVGSWVALKLWLAPMLLTKAAHQLQNTIEHLGLPHHGDILTNTRSTRTPAPIRWLCWNMPYHTAHHAFPAVPCYRLRELHEALFTQRGIEPPTMGYFEFQFAIIRALWRAKESDYPEKQAWIVSARDVS